MRSLFCLSFLLPLLLSPFLPSSVIITLSSPEPPPEILAQIRKRKKEEQKKYLEKVTRTVTSHPTYCGNHSGSRVKGLAVFLSIIQQRSILQRSRKHNRSSKARHTPLHTCPHPSILNISVCKRYAHVVALNMYLNTTARHACV